MAQDVVGIELQPGDPIVYSRHAGRSASRLELGVYRGEGKNCQLVSDKHGGKVTIYRGTILRLAGDSCLEAVRQLALARLG